MRNRLSQLTLFAGVLLFSFFSVSDVSAQEMQCQQELGQANALYTTGRFDEAIERIDACLEKENLSDLERRTAYRLKGLSFIGKGIEVDAKASVRRLMELYPNYQPDPVQDPPDFVAMVNEIKEEVNNDLSAGEPDAGEQPAEVTDESGSTQDDAPVTQPVTEPLEQPVSQVAKKKKKKTGRFLLIGAGVAAAAAGAVILTSGGGNGGGGGGGVEISEPPPLPN